jgi:hypothetical protein
MMHDAWYIQYKWNDIYSTVLHNEKWSDSKGTISVYTVVQKRERAFSRRRRRRREQYTVYLSRVLIVEFNYTVFVQKEK